MSLEPDPLADLVTPDEDLDGPSPNVRLYHAQLRIAHLEGQVGALSGQVAVLEAADQRRRAELANAWVAAAGAREGRARAEERQHLVDELRTRIHELEAKAAASGRNTSADGWHSRLRRRS